MGTLDAFSKLFAAFTGEQLKTLLETKHLYQKVSIYPTDILKKLNIAVRDKEYYLSQISEGLHERLVLTENPSFAGLNKVESFLTVKNVKLFCQECDTREAFRPIFHADITSSIKATHKTQKTLGVVPFKIFFSEEFQLFILVFQCQRCESLPTAFLVKRVKTDLYLEGRSPIEHVETPKFIPKEEQNWFRDGVIAFQTGKVLAALFYLRTFIEQFARRKTNTLGDKMTGDEIFDKYAGMIPANLKETMPSLKEWYDNLSEALHGAKEDEALFLSARQKIEEHFDIRRVHKLDGKERAELGEPLAVDPLGGKGDGKK